MPTYTALVLPRSENPIVETTIEVSAEERMKTIVTWKKSEDEVIYLQLPRGNYLQDGDCIQITELSIVLQVVPKSESVLTVTADNHRVLMRAAYHLGNRHVPLEIGNNWVRLHPDPVIETMLLELGVKIIQEDVPFYPETGAYHRH